jgi:hypothetical protein
MLIDKKVHSTVAADKKRRKIRQEKEVTRANFELLLKNLRESAGGEISAIKASNVVVERDFSSSSHRVFKIFFHSIISSL